MSKWPFPILIKYTSRGRPQKFLEGLENIYAMCAQPDYLRVLVTADLDDPTMCNHQMRDIINSYKNCKVIYGTSKSKIHAINRDLTIIPKEFDDWAILANFSDDQRWTILGYDDIIRVDYNNVYPEKLDGYMAYRDPDTHGALSTLLIAGRPFIEAFGFIYDPQFLSLFADNLVEDCAKRIGKYHYTGVNIYQHFNPAYYTHLERDFQFNTQQDLGWQVDSKTYDQIKSEGIEKYLEKFDLSKLK